ncbi:MAG: hypothetical protein ABI422_05525 [Sphingomicrobium sp.]
MNRISILAATTMLGGAAAYGAAPATKGPATNAPPPPIATYWMDAATQSGLGAGMTPGARPNIGQIMGMMSGGGSSVAHTLELRLASKQKAPAPAAEHLIPPGLAMGPSLPLVTPIAPPPERPTSMPQGYQRPQGRMLIYWGCGEHVGLGQPTVIDFSKLAAGQIPPGMAAMSNYAHAVSRPGPRSAPGYGEWPNKQDSRAVPAQGSLVGAHQVEGNYSPPIGFSLAPGQDFMPALGLAEAGALPSGASRLVWRMAPGATGYALAMFGSSGGGDVVMWSSGRNAAMFPNMDYLAPSEVRRLVGLGAVLAPTVSECVLPAEVAAASPAGMLTMIGYGPEVDFAEKPKAPIWTAKVRFKTSASLIRGMGGMDGYGGAAAQQGQPGQPGQPPKKRKKFGLGDILNGNIPGN